MRSKLPLWVRRLWMRWDLWRYRGNGEDPFRKDPYLTTNAELNREYIAFRVGKQGYRQYPWA